MSALRRAWSRSPKRKIILDEARHPIEKGPRGGTRFVCGICGRAYSSSDLTVDHIDPVVPVGTSSKDMTWDNIINRIFNSPKKNLQAVCKTCHKLKTDEENAERREVKDL